MTMEGMGVCDMRHKDGDKEASKGSNNQAYAGVSRTAVLMPARGGCGVRTVDLPCVPGTELCE